MRCQVCGAELIEEPHWEYDGFDGSYEPNFICPNGHQYPDTPDDLLDPEDLADRYKERIAITPKHYDEFDGEVFIL